MVAVLSKMSVLSLLNANSWPQWHSAMSATQGGILNMLSLKVPTVFEDGPSIPSFPPISPVLLDDIGLTHPLSDVDYQESGESQGEEDKGAVDRSRKEEVHGGENGREAGRDCGHVQEVESEHRQYHHISSSSTTREVHSDPRGIHSSNELLIPPLAYTTSTATTDPRGQPTSLKRKRRFSDSTQRPRCPIETWITHLPRDPQFFDGFQAEEDDHIMRYSREYVVDPEELVRFSRRRRLFEEHSLWTSNDRIFMITYRHPEDGT